VEKTKTYESFPVRTVILSNLNSILIYSSGFVITLRLGWIAPVIYLVFILAFEYRLISRHCVNCYYWGKICGFGKGRISALFLKKGDPLKFCEKKMSWKDMIPDLLITLIPLVIGIVSLILKFNFIILIAAVLMIASTSVGNGYIRSTLTCKFCKQRELGCPAEKLFSKTNDNQQR
jgi:hypothetical protein